RKGDTGKGRVIYYEGHPSIPKYAEFLAAELRKLPLSPGVHRALEMQRPSSVYWSVLTNGKLALFNFDDDAAVIRLADNRAIPLKPYEVKLISAAGPQETR
ncbi:MAG TPA: hypothetical protein VJ323_05755, partial [Bryobacteraceae bacterium]|nr:hypothetical protein [Bryobacteraceae bacterium]